MSRMRGRFDRERTINALLICAIIISTAIIIVPYMIPRPPPETTLRILTNEDVWITSMIEESFLNSTHADDNNIVDIEWITLDRSMWNILVGSGTIDLVMGPWRTVSDFGSTGLLVPMSLNTVLGVNESIAGVPMKGYRTGQPIWCSYVISVTVFELLVNETLLQENGLTTPETVDELLSSHYCPNGPNTSLIGVDVPDRHSIGHQFQSILTKSLEWENGIQNLTVLYANSRIYQTEGGAIDALLNGEIAITLTTFSGHAYESLHPTIRLAHLENQVVVTPSLIGISNGTQHQSHSEAFIEHILSPECQSIWLSQEINRLPIRREAFDFVIDEVDDSVYTEFNWISKTDREGVMDWFSSSELALLLYLNSTAFSARRNLTNCWENVFRAYDNGSIAQEQFTIFRGMIGNLLTIIDPETLVSESFTEDYALRIRSDLYSTTYKIEVSRLWTVAANQRYEMILNNLSALI